MDRRLSSRQVDLTKDVAKAKFRKVMEQKKAVDNEMLLDEIVKKLRAQPEQIPAVHKMLDDGIFAEKLG
eukprot:2356282-Amphidinium_carterae.1